MCDLHLKFEGTKTAVAIESDRYFAQTDGRTDRQRNTQVILALDHFLFDGVLEFLLSLQLCVRLYVWRSHWFVLALHSFENVLTYCTLVWSLFCCFRMFEASGFIFIRTKFPKITRLLTVLRVVWRNALISCAHTPKKVVVFDYL